MGHEASFHLHGALGPGAGFIEGLPIFAGHH